MYHYNVFLLTFLPVSGGHIKIIVAQDRLAP